MNNHLAEQAEPVDEASIESLDNFRREFLKKTLRLGLGLSLGLGSSLWVASCKKSNDDVRTIWDELASDLQGVLLRPSDSSFAAKASLWALRFKPVLPQGIAVCMNEEDVKTSIQWATRHHIPVVAKSGGHSYAAYSSTTGLLIDMSSMTDIQYDPPTGLVKVGGGARNKHIFAACSPIGRAITHGRCLEVGVAGLVLGGGVGFDMRLHGYTCDGLKETRIVLADGSILTCNETQNSDLFWACRGAGGGNFGIHTSFTFQTFAVEQVAAFTIEWDKKIPEVFAAIEEMTETAPNTLGIKVSVSVHKSGGDNHLTVAILGQLKGTEAQLNSLLAPVYTIQLPSSSTIEEKPYWEAQELISEDVMPEYSYERSRFVPGQLSAAAIQTILSNLSAWPGTTKAATWKYFLLGGQVDAHSAADMAIVHRGYRMLSSIELEWTAADSQDTVSRNEAWVNNFHAQMLPHTSDQCYQNFIDPEQENYLDAYYGSNLPRLQAVKKKYDPYNVFNYPQSIPAT